jgi:hypothetical protein
MQSLEQARGRGRERARGVRPVGLAEATWSGSTR